MKGGDGTQQSGFKATSIHFTFTAFSDGINEKQEFSESKASPSFV